MTNSTACPACGRQLEPNTVVVCRTCWPKVPAQDRRQLGAMRLRRQDTRTKLEKIVRGLKANA